MEIRIITSSLLSVAIILVAIRMVIFASTTVVIVVVAFALLLEVAVTTFSIIVGTIFRVIHNPTLTNHVCLFVRYMGIQEKT